MKRFNCQSCGNLLYFDNTVCVSCNHRLGFVPRLFTMSAVEPDGNNWKVLADPKNPYNFCSNSQYEACNWLVPLTSATELCEACRHNRVIPDLSLQENVANWRKIEAAKRHLFYSLLRWRLPVSPTQNNQQTELTFAFLSDVEKDDGQVERVITGYANGLVTINIAEADDAEREKRRTSMDEPYRTLLGHFRHEVGHYYWESLVRDRNNIDNFRALFGDETVDYGEALKHYYVSGPPPGWQGSYISAYATAHPWEDFAETWAHYVHMVDGLETARAFGVSVRPTAGGADAPTEIDFDPYAVPSAANLVEHWIPFTLAINSVNRSIGQPDLYPFVLSLPVVAKLQFVHDMVHRSGLS